MKVLQPTNTTHTIKMDPRFYPVDVLNLRIVKEGANTFEDSVPAYSVLNGVMSLTFDLIGLEGSKYTIKLTENEKIVYRCKLFFTGQDPQNYKLTKNKYIYAG